MLYLLTACHTIQSANRLALNDKTLKDWYVFQDGQGIVSNPHEIFKIENSTLQLFGEKKAYLMSKKSFENFRLTAEYRWNTNSDLPKRIAIKNSGIMYLVPSDEKDMFWPKGVQFQIKEGSTGDFIFLQNVTLNIHGETSKPGESVVVSRLANAEKPIGDWNTVVVEVNHGKVIQMLNGVIVNEGINPSVKKGRVLLQYEGYPIDFRNVIVEKF